MLEVSRRHRQILGKDLDQEEGESFQVVTKRIVVDVKRKIRVRRNKRRKEKRVQIR